MDLMVRWFGDIAARYREGTTDEKVLREVVDRAGYRKKSIGFDVETGEHWLDLGANIGAFAIYCKTKDATAQCYEPEADCFSVLERNARGFQCFRTCVTASREPQLRFWKSRNTDNHYRGSIYQTSAMIECDYVPNLFIGDVVGQFDGIKMDIEGSEFGIIDAELVPPCKKLCLEYHTSRDSSMENLARRLNLLRKRFKRLFYPPEFDRKIKEGGNHKTYFDRFIFCWDPL